MEMEKDYEKNWVRLPLVFASNVRELGGYPVEEGGQTAYHRFLRADDISELSESDVQFLLRYGVTSVLDLRSDGEVCRKPDVLAGVSGVLWKNVPFLRGETGDMSRYAGEGRLFMHPSLSGTEGRYYSRYSVLLCRDNPYCRDIRLPLPTDRFYYRESCGNIRVSGRRESFWNP